MSASAHKLLIVDDEPVILKVLKREISQYCPGVFTAASSEEALAILQNENISLLITDLKMPMMGGIELVKIAKQYQPDLQCVLMSGYGKKNDAIEAMRVGIFDFIDKPIDSEELKNIVSRAISNLELIQKQKTGKKEELEKIELLIKSSSQGLLGIDLNGQITFANSTAKKILRVTDNSFIGKEFYEFAHLLKKNGESILKQDCPIFAPVKTKKQSKEDSILLQTKEGVSFPVSIVSTPIIKNGIVEAAIVSIIDIQQKEKNQKLLQDKDLYLSSILENSLSGIFLVDKETCIISYANPAGLKIIGLTREQIIGRECHGLICPDEKGDCPFPEANGKSTLECMVLGSDRKKIPVMKNVTTVVLNDREYLLENMIDLSKQQNISRNLDKSHKAFEAIVNQSQDGMIIVDRDGYIKFINDAGLSIFGRSRAELLDSLFGFPTPENETTELNIIRPDGKKNDVEMRVAKTEWAGEPAFLTSLRDITIRKLMEEHIRHAAGHDPLTDLPNRYLLPDRLNQMIHLARRNKKQMAVFFIDLDDFKPINDHFGHDMGDIVLEEVAIRLQKEVRSSDTVARLGGDEFALVLYDIHSQSDITNIAQKLITSLNQPIEIGDKECQIGACIGISRFPQNSEEPDQLLKLADAAMYEAKRRGKNQYCFFNETHHEVI